MTQCARCDRPVVPFGELKQIVRLDDGRAICYDCARVVAPMQAFRMRELERAAAAHREDEAADESD
jgi:recombinational DNA repair protein (RecF pathway)